MLVRDIMTERVISISPDHGVRQAAQLMLDHRVSGLPVIDNDGRLAGMLTEGDLLRRAELGTAAFAPEPSRSDDTGDGYIRTHSWRVGDVMTRHVVTADETMPIDRLAAIMSANDIKRVPVVRGDRMVGIASRADILRGLATAPRENIAPGDDAIRRAVSTRLYADLKLNPTMVGITVSGGTVRLWGRIASEAASRAAEVATESVQGVRGVSNNLRVSQPDMPK